MQFLIQNYKRLLSKKNKIYHRKFYDNFVMNNRFIGIIGERGVGKTTFLLNFLKNNFLNNEKALYITADHVYFSENNLISFTEKFINIYDGKILCIDEIHKYKNWQQELKNIYDTYPQIKILFSGSSSINLVKGKYDLSRRVILKKMYGFSFREYLEIKTQKKFPVLHFNDLLVSILEIEKNITNIPQILGHFKKYLKNFYYPTGLEIKSYDVFCETLMNIIEKIIFEDISSNYLLKTQNLHIFRKIVYFFATSPTGKLNINKLSNSLKKDYSTIAHYLQILKESGLLLFLSSDKYGHNFIRKAEKIYISNTNILFAINNFIGKNVNIGAMREIFVINNLFSIGKKIFYPQKGDISCENKIFEIGGASKNQSQIKNLKNSYLIKDDILYQDKNIIPMYLFGFLR